MDFQRFLPATVFEGLHKDVATCGRRENRKPGHGPPCDEMRELRFEDAIAAAQGGSLSMTKRSFKHKGVAFPSATWERGISGLSAPGSPQKRLVCRSRRFVSRGVPRRAILIFADEMHVDLARRSFPKGARPLLSVANIGPEVSSAIDVHLFTARDSRDTTPHIHRQAGRDFAARFENAIERIAQLGYDEVVAIGRDCPGLRAIDIERAFAELATRKLVLGPDHRGGCYLIAFRSADREFLRGVRWKQNTDCAQLRNRCGDERVFLLPVKHDLDSWADVRIFARGGDPRARLALFLLGLVCAARTRLVHFVSSASQRMRVRQQMPPPALAA
jgi:hypothetical protein